MLDERYIPKIGCANWNIKELEKEERTKIKERLVVGITHSEEDYQAVISYLHMKYTDLMDVCTDDGKRLQWRYIPHDDKIQTIDTVSGNHFDMYGFVYYDPERDMEPVAVGGSYLKGCGPVRYPKSDKKMPNEIIPGQNINKHGHVHVGHGYILFIDPDYRRLGLAEAQWLTEAQLYRDSNIKYQKETQTMDALKVTQAMFDDPAKCMILSKGKTNLRGKYEAIKCAMDYTDESLIRNFGELPENLKDFRKSLNWSFLKREGLDFSDLIEPWKKHKK